MGAKLRPKYFGIDGSNDSADEAVGLQEGQLCCLRDWASGGKQGLNFYSLFRSVALIPYGRPSIVCSAENDSISAVRNRIANLERRGLALGRTQPGSDKVRRDGLVFVMAHLF